MKKPIILLTVAINASILLFFLSRGNPSLSSSPRPLTATNSSSSMARSFVLWLHGLGDSGPANEPIKTLFTSPEFRAAKWSFPSAPSNPVTCNYGAVMPSWFDIHEIPVTADSPKDETSLLKAVKNVHAMIDKEISAGVDPNNVFVCGFSQGGSLSADPVASLSTYISLQKLLMVMFATFAGALTLTSVLLYPKTLGGSAVFSGWVPFNSSMLEQISPHGKKTPILWSHGMADRTVLFEAGQAGPPFLEQAGVSCEFKAYPGLGHSISNEELRYLESWIKARLQSSS